MKREIDRIGKQIERTYSGEAWHGPSITEVLDGVDAEAAAARPIPGAHSIQDLVSHIVAWQEETVRRIEGNGRDLPVEEDWPREIGWEELLERLRRSHEALSKAAASIEEEALDTKVKGRRESYYVLLHGIIHHNLYHAGQIAILKKGLEAR
ncbi:MAG: DinB family protein [Vicinamibacteria bacterium]